MLRLKISGPPLRKNMFGMSEYYRLLKVAEIIISTIEDEYNYLVCDMSLLTININYGEINIAGLKVDGEVYVKICFNNSKNCIEKKYLVEVTYSIRKVEKLKEKINLIRMLNNDEKLGIVAVIPIENINEDNYQYVVV